MRVGRIDSWSDEITVEVGFFKTTITINNKEEIALDKSEVKQLIKLLEESIR